MENESSGLRFGIQPIKYNILVRIPGYPSDICPWCYTGPDPHMVLRRKRRRLHKRCLYAQRLIGRAVMTCLALFLEASTLDTWVLEQLGTLFHNATSDPVLDLQLRQEKTVFFLHLLGLDVTGHSHRPRSRVRIPCGPYSIHTRHRTHTVLCIRNTWITLRL